MKIKYLYLLPFILLSSIIFIFYIKFERINENKLDNNILSPLIGNNIPEINITNPERGENINFKKYNKRIFAVNFFASWCLPCKVESPILDKLSSSLDIIGISYKDKKIEMINFLQNYGNPYKEIGIDKKGTIAIEWGVYGVPETFIVDNGKIIYKHTGPINYEDLNSKILPLINKQ